MMKYVSIPKYGCMYMCNQIFGTQRLSPFCPLDSKMPFISWNDRDSKWLLLSLLSWQIKVYIASPSAFEILLVCEYRCLGKTWLLVRRRRPLGSLSLMRLYHWGQWFSSLAAFYCHLGSLQKNLCDFFSYLCEGERGAQTWVWLYSASLRLLICLGGETHNPEPPQKAWRESATHQRAIQECLA